MQHQHEQSPGNSNSQSWWTRSNLAWIGFLAIAGFYLVTEHRAHFFGFLPILLLLACPLLHVFMHGGHGKHGGHDGSKK
jgi:hypothetical protein